MEEGELTALPFADDPPALADGPELVCDMIDRPFIGAWLTLVSASPRCRLTATGTAAPPGCSPGRDYTHRVIFKAVGEGRPYPDHGLTTAKDWAAVAPRQVRLDDLVTTKRTLNLDNLLSEDSTFYGDLFAHVVQYRGVMYLEDGLHRAVRAALQQRPVLHARVLVVDS